MKKLNLPLALLFFFNASTSLARPILLQAPTISQVKYLEFLNSHPNTQSYTDYIEAHLQNNPKQENKLFKLSDLLEVSTTDLLQNLKTLHREEPLTLTSLRYMRDLSEKVLQKNEVKKPDPEYLNIYCKTTILLNEGPSVYSCAKTQISLLALKKKYPQVEKALIETIPFSLVNNESITIVPQTPYQWTLLSNTQQPVHFYGTYQQLLNQKFQLENLISGDCDGFSYQNLDFEVINEGVIFFSESCQKRPQGAMEKKSWASEKKTLLYIAGGLLATGLIYNHVKGKKYMLDTSALW